MQTPPHPTTGPTGNEPSEPHARPTPACPIPGGLTDELADYAERVMAATGLSACDLIAVASTPEANGLPTPDRAGVDAVIGQALRAGWAAVAEDRQLDGGIDSASDDNEGHQR